MTTKHIIIASGVFTGLYEWGAGWNMETIIKWRAYWAKLKSIYWNYIEDASNNSQYLYGLYGSIFLHPERFEVVISSSINPDRVLEELNKICAECANACGGTFRLEIKNKVTIES